MFPTRLRITLGSLTVAKAIHLYCTETTEDQINATTTTAHCLSASTNNPLQAIQDQQTIHDCLVIGGGVVGLAVGRELAVRGHSVLLLEKTNAICTGASSGNSGIGCTGYDAPEGSIERKLLRRSILRHPNLYRSLGLGYRHINKCGALVVAWKQDELHNLQQVLEENVQAGDTESCILNQTELLEMEPSLNQLEPPLGAVHAPREMVTEPWLVPIAYANSMLLNGGQIRVHSEVIGAELKTNTDTENTENKENTENRKKVWHVKLADGDVVRARTIFNCAGLFGDLLEKEILGKTRFNIFPRKGQFVIYAPLKEKDSINTIIEPVPTLRTKGVIVWKSVYGNIISGPTAEEQSSRSDRSNTVEVIEMLKRHAEKVLPQLKGHQIVGTYSGIRPASEYRDYQISINRAKQWVTVGGIRSTGLTAASGISEYVTDLYENQENEIHSETVLPPYLPSLPLQNMDAVPNPPAPSLQELSSDFYARNDGTVSVFGKSWQVTHPLSSIGMETMGKLYPPKRKKEETLPQYKVRYEQWKRKSSKVYT